ncbi:hypothetical protein GKZ67_08320 [Hymenobacter sp. BRD67]|nr:hypothetical protein [Hymenobacter sp. BRD67]QKG52602.1 hypothetical protein GKZ67_08320 [Hymenobacter sp. BRD67]
MRIVALLSISIGLLAVLAQGRARPVAPGSPSATRYWVRFSNKDGVPFDPARYFSSAAQARRQRQGLPAAEFTDRPVRPDYVAAVRAGVDTLTVVSRWFNAVACRATPAQAAALRRLPGVAAVVAWPVSRQLRPARYERVRIKNSLYNKKILYTAQSVISPADYQLARQQTAALGRADLKRAGLLGQGVRIAVLDVGFRGAERHPAFRALRHERRIAATYDFLKNQPDVFRGGSHGTEVLGCLAGRLPAPIACTPARRWAWPRRLSTCWPAPKAWPASALPKKRPGSGPWNGPTSRVRTSSAPPWLIPSSATFPSRWMAGTRSLGGPPRWRPTREYWW